MSQKRKLPAAMEATKFKPGQSGNPNGRPPLNPIQRALKELTVKTYSDVIEAVLTGNIDNLKSIIVDEGSPAIKVGVATAFLKAVKSGDYGVIEKIAERIVGKIPDELNVNSKNINVHRFDMVKMKVALKKLEEDV